MPNRSGAQQEWRQAQGRFGARAGYAFFAFVIKTFGRAPAYVCLRYVALYYLFIRGAGRRATYPYLRRRFPERTGWRRWLDAYRLIVSFGETLIDRGAIGLLGTDCFDVEFPEDKELRALADEGNGVILLTSHVGNWQAAMSTLGAMGRPVSLLMTRDDAHYIRHYFELAGQACPFNIVDPTGFLGGTIELTAALGRGEVVSMMGDRLLGQGSVEAEFLGDHAPIPNGAYPLAMSTGAALVALTSTKTGRSRYAIELLMVERPRAVARKERRAEIDRLARRYATALEDYVKRNPYQWFNFFDTWQSAPDKAGESGDMDGPQG